MAALPGRRPGRCPAPLVAVGAGHGRGPRRLDLPVAGSRSAGCWRPSSRPARAASARWPSVGVVGTVLAFTLIASAESLFSAAAVDRLHDGPRTDYDKELMAQGVGNTVCGALGALPMTAVIVRSAANVPGRRADEALPRAARRCGCCCSPRCFPAAIGVIPLAALAGRPGPRGLRS